MVAGLALPDFLVAVMQLTDLPSVHNEHIKALPMTTAHAFVITHHDFEAYPSWVSLLTCCHVLKRHSSTHAYAMWQPPLPAPVSWLIRNVVFWRHYRSVQHG